MAAGIDPHPIPCCRVRHDGRPDRRGVGGPASSAHPACSAGRAVQPAADGDELGAAVRQARRGSEPAFSQLYRAVQPALIRYLSSLVGADCEDVAAETWLQVCRDLHTFDGDGDGFRGWVMTIGRHRALDQVRARGRRRRIRPSS